MGRFIPVAAAAVIFTGSCANNPQEAEAREDLEARVDALEHQLEEARDKAQEVEDAASHLQSVVSDLQSDVARFDGENWREVVPSISGDVDDIESAGQAVQAASGEMTEAVAEH